VLGPRQCLTQPCNYLFLSPFSNPMALRVSSKRVCAMLRASRVNSVSVRHASAAAALKGSSLPRSFIDSTAVGFFSSTRSLGNAMVNGLQGAASLPTPDPVSSSKTAGLVNQQLPYMVPTYVRPPPMFEKGEGCYMWDVEGRKYLDFTAGIAVNALGHCDAGVAQVLAEQVRRAGGGSHAGEDWVADGYRHINSSTPRTFITTPIPACSRSS